MVTPLCSMYYLLEFIDKSRMKQRPIATGSKAANDVLMGHAGLD